MGFIKSKGVAFRSSALVDGIYEEKRCDIS